MNTKTQNTKKKIIKSTNNNLPSISNILIDTATFTNNADFEYFDENYKTVLEKIVSGNKLTWENLSQIGSENLAIIIKAVRATLFVTDTKVVTSFGGFDKQMRPLKNMAIKNKYLNALKALEEMVKTAVYKPLMTCFRTEKTYTKDTYVVYYPDDAKNPYWDVCVITSWHNVIASTGYKYMPSNLQTIKKGMFHRDNDSLFMEKELNKMLSVNEFKWFSKHANDKFFIGLWFATSNLFLPALEKGFLILRDFMTTITSNDTFHNSEFVKQEYEAAKTRYNEVRSRYKNTHQYIQ